MPNQNNLFNLHMSRFLTLLMHNTRVNSKTYYQALLILNKEHLKLVSPQKETKIQQEGQMLSLKWDNIKALKLKISFANSESTEIILTNKAKKDSKRRLGGNSRYLIKFLMKFSLVMVRDQLSFRHLFNNNPLPSHREDKVQQMDDLSQQNKTQILSSLVVNLMMTTGKEENLKRKGNTLNSFNSRCIKNLNQLVNQLHIEKCLKENNRLTNLKTGSLPQGKFKLTSKC